MIRYTSIISVGSLSILLALFFSINTVKSESLARPGCVTFIVDLCGTAEASDGVYFAASFQGWDEEPMCDMGGGIWEISYCGIEPGTHEYKFLNGSGGWEFNGFGDDCTNPADNNNRFVDASGDCDVEGPWCFNTCDEGNGSGPDDSNPPVLTGNLPGDITISCEDDIPEPELLEAEDDCSYNCTSEEAIDDDSDLDECGLGIIIRTWQVFDCAGNEGEPHVQEIRIVDNEAPAFDERVDDITLSCGESLPAGVPLEVIDNCDEDLEFSEEPVDDLSGLDANGLGEIVRTWFVEDCSGNPNEIFQSIFLTGVQANIYEGELCVPHAFIYTDNFFDTYQWLRIDSMGVEQDLGVNNDTLYIVESGIYKLIAESADCTSEDTDTIQIFQPAQLSSRDTSLCASSNLIIDLNDLIIAGISDSVIYYDPNGDILEDSNIDLGGFTGDIFTFRVEAISDTLCPVALDSIEVRLEDCNCPQVDDIGNYCIQEFSDTLDLLDIKSFDDAGIWLIEPASVYLEIFGDSLIVHPDVEEGLYTLEFVFNDSMTNQNCDELADPLNTSVIVLFHPEMPEFQSGTLLCNTDVGNTLPFILDLDTILLNELEGSWNSMNNLSIDPGNTVDFRDASPGNYEFQFIVEDDQDCPSVSGLITVEVLDCSCPVISTVADSSVCSSQEMIDLNGLVLAGTGNWTYLEDGPDMSAGLVNEHFFDISIIDEGVYSFEYKLDSNEINPDCDSISRTSIEVFQSPEIIYTSFDTSICNGPNEQDKEFMLNLFGFLMQGTDDGEWSSNDYTGDLSNPFNVDFSGVSPGTYEFIFTTIKAAVEGSGCQDINASFFVEVMDCSCPDLPDLDTRRRCISGDSILLDANFTLLGTWTLLDPNDQLVDTLENNIIYTDDLSSSGRYTVRFDFLPDQIDPACNERWIEFYVRVEDEITADIPSFMEVCDSPGFSIAETFVNFNELSSSIEGEWISLSNFPGTLDNLDSVSFEGLSNLNFDFEFVIDPGSNPCPANSYILNVEVLACSCPNVEISQAMPLCNDNDVLDLGNLLTPDIVEGEFSIEAPDGSEVTVNGNLVNIAGFDPGIYIISYSSTETIPGPCPQTSSVELTIEAAESAGSGRDTSFCINMGTVIDLFGLLDDENEGGNWTQLMGQTGGLNSAEGTFDSDAMDPGLFVFVYGFEATTLCNESFTTVEIEILPLPVADAGMDMQIDCVMQEVLVGGTGAMNPDFSYEWRDESGNLIDEDKVQILISEAGELTLTVFNKQTGCFSMDTVLVVINSDFPNAELSQGDSDCMGDNSGWISFENLSGGNGAYDIFIEGDTLIERNTDQDITIENLPPGTYDAFVISDGCSSDTTTITINEGQDLSFSFDPDILEFELGENFDISLETTELNLEVLDQLVWMNEGEVLCSGSVVECGNISFSPLMNTELLVNVIDTFGCEFSTGLEFRLIEIENLYIPNIFLPGDLGENGRLRVYGNSGIENILSYRIFDRWGNLVFEREGPYSLNSGDEMWWDGRYNGTLVQSGVYILQLEYTSSSEAEKSKFEYKSISILR